MIHAVPSAEEQLAFIRKLRRLLDEGQFVATYKYALLHAIADLCVVRGDDTGAPLTLATRELAERFVRLYWRQAAPFPAADADRPLKQNTGRQAAVVNVVREARAEYDDRLGSVEGSQAWGGIVGRVERVVRTMPLWKLRHFLFGTERRDLSAYRDILTDIQEGQCFYCGRRLRRDAVAVDHFVPWRRYPLDLAHNFVLAHRGCNGAKGDRLAAVPHLERWHVRNVTGAYELPRRFEGAGLVHDWTASRKITRWAYGQVAQAGGQVWVRGDELVRLAEGWEGVLGFA